MQPIKKIKEKQERLLKELLIENDNFAKEIHPRLKKKKTFNRKPTLKNYLANNIDSNPKKEIISDKNLNCYIVNNNLYQQYIKDKNNYHNNNDNNKTYSIKLKYKKFLNNSPDNSISEYVNGKIASDKINSFNKILPIIKEKKKKKINNYESNFEFSRKNSYININNLNNKGEKERPIKL